MVVLFVAAVAAIVAVVNYVAALAFATHGYVSWNVGDPILTFDERLARVPRYLYYAATAVTLGVIAYGTLSRIAKLSAGGAAVADMVDARRVARDTQDAAERRLMNVVEEMAIASGIAAPLVYVMDRQRSINAFAAGYSPNAATIIVTRGCLDSLDREELQGVVAHEFSHILNGDMRLNIRLLGIIAGIVMIGSLGRWLTGVDRARDEDRGIAFFWAAVTVGLALWILGSIGVLFGQLIKAVVSREREFLADASAVQFTRNPDGIGGALYKIAERGGVVPQMYAQELSHMYIASPVNSYLEISWMRTHPPIEERIERILGPAAKYRLRERAKRAEAATAAARPSPVVSELASPLYARTPDPVRTTASAVLASVGRPSEQHVDYAQQLLAALPAELRSATQTPDGAKAVVYALLLGDGAIRAAQLDRVGDAALAARAAALADLAAKLDARICMPLLGLVIPTLKVLPTAEREQVLQVARHLAEADRKMSLHEFALLTVLRRPLDAETGVPPAKYRDVAAVAKEAALVLSLLAQAGGGGEPALYKGMAALGLRGGMLTERSALGLAAVESALRELALLAPLKKPLLIKACLEVVMADGRIAVAEGELMRAICAALDTPLPPILDAAPQEAVAATPTQQRGEYAVEERHAI